MGHPSFLTLALRRTRYQWGLTALSVLGVALAVGLVAGIPIFTDSVGFQILKKELARHAYGNTNPPLAMRYYRIPSAPEPMTVQRALDTGAWLAQMTAHEVGLPIAHNYTQIGSHALTMRALPENTRNSQRELRQVRIVCVPRVEDQIEIIGGLPFSEADLADELLVWARPAFVVKLGIEPGETFELFSFNAVHPDRPLRFRIAGIWQAQDPAGPFWYRDPHDLLEEEFLTSVGAFARFVAPFMPQQIDFSFWYHVLDHGRLRFDDVDQYALGVLSAQYKAEGMLPSIRVDRSPIEPLQEVQQRTRVLKQLLFGFSLPVIALLLFFVAAISSIAVRYQRSELAILMSRGAGPAQVIGISALEGLIHMGLGTPLGILFSLGFARAMSLNTGFLTFDRSAPLPLATQALDWRLVGLALGVCLAARLLPTLRASSHTVVTYGRERARTRRRNLGARLLVGAVLIATSAYAYHQLRVRGTFGLVSWQPEGGARNDPLLFLAPTLFVITVAWLVSQLFPYFVRIPDLIGALLPSPSLYLGLRNLARESGAYRLPLFLLTACLCLGAFEASIARSADEWLTDRWRYKVGADFSFELGTMPLPYGAGMAGQDSWLLPVGEWAKLPGVRDATRVGSYTANSTLRNRRSVRLLGIDRLDFARVAYFRRDYAREPLGELLNRLGAESKGILVTRSFLQESALGLGDTFPLDVYVDAAVQRIHFVIVGAVDYFPTIYEDQVVMVANLDYIHRQCGGVQPHGIWLRTAPGTSSRALLDSLEEMGVVPVHEMDSRHMIAEDQQRLERVGIFGNLSVGFLAGSLLAWLGMLIYTFASLIGRTRRFTVLRAIGLGLRQVLTTVSIEYLGVILYGIFAGTVAGVMTSRLFIPYFQFTEDPSIQVPPFVPRIAWTEILWIIVAYFAVLTLAELIVLARATQREVFQALRLGEEE